MNTPVQKTGLTPLNIAFACVCLLMFVYALLAFHNRGALGYEAGVKRGGILIMNNLLMTGFIFHNQQQLRNHTGLLKVVICWLLWVSITSITLLFYDNHTFFKGLVEVLYCPLFFVFFYVFSSIRPNRTQQIINVFIVMVGFISLLFVFAIRYQSRKIWHNDFQQVNDVYYVLLLMPWVLVCQKKIWKYAGLFLIAGIVFWSLKRTALIAFILALMSYYLLEIYCSQLRFKMRWMITFTIIIVSFIFLYSIIEIRTGGILTNRILNMSEDEGSGRLEIYRYVIQDLQQNSLKSWIIGHGHDGVRRENVFNVMRPDGIYSLSAHNDFLEVLFDHGLPALILYLLFHIELLKWGCRLIIRRSQYGPSMVASYMIFCTISMTSHLVLYPTYFCYLMAFWGMINTTKTQHKAINRTKMRSAYDNRNICCKKVGTFFGKRHGKANRIGSVSGHYRAK